MLGDFTYNLTCESLTCHTSALYNSVINVYPKHVSITTLSKPSRIFVFHSFINNHSTNLLTLLSTFNHSQFNYYLEGNITTLRTDKASPWWAWNMDANVDDKKMRFCSKGAIQNNIISACDHALHCKDINHFYKIH